MEVLCFSHADCLDGMAAAWAVKLKFPNAEVRFVEYQVSALPTPEEVAGKHVIVTDFSYDLDVMEEIYHHCAKMTFLDHHRRSEHIAATLQVMQNELGETKGEFHYDVNRSGGMMTWQHFHPDVAVPLLIEIVSDYDLWRFKYSCTKQCIAGLETYPLDLDSWIELLDWDPLLPDFHTAAVHRICADGVVAKRKKEVDITRIIQQTQRLISLGDHDDVPLINVPKAMSSTALHRLTPHCLFAAGYYDTAEHRVFSLRSHADSGFKVNELAQQFGGGGHDHAAGFKVSRDHPLAQL